MKKIQFIILKINIIILIFQIYLLNYIGFLPKHFLSKCY